MYQSNLGSNQGPLPRNWKENLNSIQNPLKPNANSNSHKWPVQPSSDDFLESISKQNVNIASVDIKVIDSIAEAHFIVQVNNNRQLNRLMQKMTKLKNIDYVERTGR